MGAAKKRGTLEERIAQSMAKDYHEYCKAEDAREQKVKDDADALEIARQIILFHQEQANPRRVPNLHDGKLVAS